MLLSYLRNAAVITLFTSLAACTSTQSQQQQLATQDATLHRWASCVDRQSSTDSIHDALSRIERYCEGHKRDLLAAYPPHQAKKLNAALADQSRDRAQRRVSEFSSSEEAHTISVTLK